MRFTFCVGVLYALIAVIFLVANAVVLGMFGYKFGHGEWGKWLFAVVAASVPFALAPHLHVMSAKRRMLGRRRWLSGLWGCIPFLIVYVLFVGYNLLGGTGATAFARTEQADERRHVIDETKRLTDQRAALKSQLDAVPKHRPRDAVDALIARTKLHPFWTATSQCQDQIINKGRRNYCAEIDTLIAERASADKADGLLARITAIDAKLGEQGRAVSDDDPQMRFLADMTGLSKAQVLMILLLATPLILEVGALYWGSQALQLLGIHIEMQAPPTPDSSPRKLLPAPPSVARLLAASDAAEAARGHFTSVAGSLPPSDPALQRAVYERFWAEQTRPMPGGRESAVAVYAAYRAFCARPENRTAAYDFDTFARCSGERGIETSETAGVMWWLGFVVTDPMGAV